MDVEVRIHRGPQGLEHLAGLWHGLSDAMKERHFVHALDWNQCFLDWQEPEPDSVLFAAIFTDGALQAILPLRPVRRSAAAFTRRGLEVPTNPHVPLTDIVVADAARLRAAVPRVIAALATQCDVPWDFIVIPRTLTDSGAMKSFYGVPGVVARAREAGRLDYLPLRTYEELFASLSSRFRNNLRRARKRADALGDVTYHTASHGADCEALFAEFLQVEASGWKGWRGTGTAIALDDDLRGFYAALMHRFAEQGDCRIHVVRHAGKPIAACFSLIADHTLYGLKIGFEESYSKIAPGNLLHEYVFRTSCEDPRIETFNMASDASWHAQWRPESSELRDLFVFRPGLRGRVALHERAVLDRARAWRRRVAARFLVTERGHRRLAWPPWRGRG